MNDVIMKFGGTSVGTPDAIRRLTAIVSDQVHKQVPNDLPPVVVVSALSKVTNQLLNMAKLATQRKTRQANHELRSLAGRHKTILATLAGTDSETDSYIRSELHDLADLVHALAITKELTPRQEDAIAAVGELLSSRIVAAALREEGIPSVWLDARKVMVTDTNHTRARPEMAATSQKTKALIEPLRAQGKVVVLGGYIGETADGVTTTVGRQGSDYSASVFGACLGVDEVQIWTDVDGMMTADPKIVPSARLLPEVSYDEAGELATFGAKVLHPRTVQPAVKKGIRVRILNSHNPESHGTAITARPNVANGPVTAVTLKKGVALITLTSSEMLDTSGFLWDVFGVFAKYRVSVDMVATTEVSVSVSIDNPDKLAEIQTDLSRFGEVSVEKDDRALICVVGSRLKDTPGVAKRLFGVVPPANIHAISHGKQINVSFIVKESEADDVVRRIHEEFFGS